MDKDIHNFLCVFRFKSVRTLLRPSEAAQQKSFPIQKRHPGRILVPWGCALPPSWKGNLALRE
ncbi:hypothetical protein CPter91_3805 [Collimonas pratensis]|uniref:Uncharacterized protein n=1 Tax=Collimonas pratensis TaxID=279113 RepID=A0A127Q805_9BURK|nr:hypothetical protein CPter91_3805 [Collimonas pratensis]